MKKLTTKELQDLRNLSNSQKDFQMIVFRMMGVKRTKANDPIWLKLADYYKQSKRDRRIRKVPQYKK